MIKPLRAAFFMLPGTTDPESPGCRTVTDGKRNKMEKNRQIIVVGAGAAGMMAAISAARSGAAVTILEGMKKPGRKLLMTGNGKCNLTHLDPAIREVYGCMEGCSSAAEDFVHTALSVFGVRATLDFFEGIGVFCRQRDGYVYPRSEQAQTVLAGLCGELERLHVKTKYNSIVDEIRCDEENGKWQVSVNGWISEADAVILCCGSKTAPGTGSDGSGYDLAKSAGHRVTELSPALTALICDDPDLALASGARTKAKVTLLTKGSAAAGEERVLAAEEGEVQWAEHAVSGIAVFQLSRFISEGLLKRGLQLAVDLVPDRSLDELKEALERTRLKNETAGARQLLNGWTHDRVAGYLVRCLDRQAKEQKDEAACLAGILKEVRLHVTGTRGYDQAQVAKGGVSLKEVNRETLESVLRPGLYFAGEILDIDGPCGGYNLQWAWSSGYLAGCSAAGTWS